MPFTHLNNADGTSACCVFCAGSDINFGATRASLRFLASTWLWLWGCGAGVAGRLVVGSTGEKVKSFTDLRMRERKRTTKGEREGERDAWESVEITNTSALQWGM